MTLRVGLTGGIGCGKSAAAEAFRALGVPVVDADEIAHRLTAPDGPLVPAIVAAFGPRVLAAEGTLDRRRLRELVFADPAARQRLESIVHPAVRAEIARWVATLSDDVPYCIIVVPLLIETGLDREVDHVIVVDCEKDQQVARVSARDHLRPTEILPIMRAQVSRRERRGRADTLLDNTGSRENLWAQVATVHKNLCELARKQQQGEPAIQSRAK